MFNRTGLSHFLQLFEVLEVLTIENSIVLLVWRILVRWSRANRIYFFGLSLLIDLRISVCSVPRVWLIFNCCRCFFLLFSSFTYTLSFLFLWLRLRFVCRCLWQQFWGFFVIKDFCSRFWLLVLKWLIILLKRSLVFFGCFLGSFLYFCLIF
jgi:hypothetical protein